MQQIISLRLIILANAKNESWAFSCFILRDTSFNLEIFLHVGEAIKNYYDIFEMESVLSGDSLMHEA